MPDNPAVSAEDALLGSGTSLTLCAGEVLIVKVLCGDQQALIQSVKFSVRNIQFVQMFFTDKASTTLRDPSVSIACCFWELILFF